MCRRECDADLDLTLGIAAMGLYKAPRRSELRLIPVLSTTVSNVKPTRRGGAVGNTTWTTRASEVAMMIPVVFLVLPVTVIFAFYPGLVGLRLTSGT